jgi:hypothetical protein
VMLTLPHVCVAKARCALATSVAQLFCCLDGEHSFIGEHAHWQLFCCCNLKVAAWPIPKAIELLLIMIGCTCFSLSAHSGNKTIAC